MPLLSLKDTIIKYLRHLKDEQPDTFIEFMVHGSRWGAMQERIWQKFFIKGLQEPDGSDESSLMWFDLNNLPMQFYNLGIMTRILHERLNKKEYT